MSELQEFWLIKAIYVVAYNFFLKIYKKNSKKMAKVVCLQFFLCVRVPASAIIPVKTGSESARRVTHQSDFYARMSSINATFGNTRLLLYKTVLKCMSKGGAYSPPS